MFRPEATNAEAAAYREQVKKYFNHAVTENALKWPDMEPKKDEIHYELVDAMAGWCRTNGIVLRGHCLFWSCHIPEWAKALSDVDLRFAIMRRARNVVGHYRGLIDEFDVNNEMLHCTALSHRLGDSIFRQMCAEASGANPNAVLYVNDYGILEGNELNRYEEQIRDLLEAGAPVGGIGLQAHFDGAANVGRMQKALDALARFNLPIKITEFDCSADDEAVQARTLEDVYRTAFAHSAVEGILMWGFWEKCPLETESRASSRGFFKEAVRGNLRASRVQQLVDPRGRPDRGRRNICVPGVLRRFECQRENGRRLRIPEEGRAEKIQGRGVC